MSPFDTGYEEERGRDAYRREHYTLMTMDRHGNVTPFGALSLRDMFAGQALIGLVQNNDVTPNVGAYAKIAYEVADAMLEARK